MDPIDGAKGDWVIKLPPDTANEHEIEITFKPDAAADGCKSVFLVQTSKSVAYKENGEEYTAKHKEMYKKAKDNPYQHREDDEVDDPSGHPVSIDHAKCEGDPFYNGRDLYQDPEKSEGDATARPNPTPTVGKDDPKTPFDNKKDVISKIVISLETCAICAETGEILGCVTWKSTATPTNKGKPTLDAEEEKPPSETFKKALRKYMEKHAKTKDGVTRWYCPDPKGPWIGPGASADDDPYDEHHSDPWGFPMPDGFKTAWVDPPAEGDGSAGEGSGGGEEEGGSNEEPGGGSEDEPPGEGQFYKLDPDRVGEGMQFGTVEEALSVCAEDPSRTAIKFTWAGDQVKPILGVVLAPQGDLSSSALSPFVDNRTEFSNDFANGLRTLPVDPETMHKLVEQLARFPTSLDYSGGPAIITLMGRLGSADAAAYTGQLSVTDVGAVSRAALASTKPGTELRAALRYLANNFGDGAVRPQKSSISAAIWLLSLLGLALLLVIVLLR